MSSAAAALQETAPIPEVRQPFTAVCWTSTAVAVFPALKLLSEAERFTTPERSFSKIWIRQISGAEAADSSAEPLRWLPILTLPAGWCWITAAFGDLPPEMQAEAFTFTRDQSSICTADLLSREIRIRKISTISRYPMPPIFIQRHPRRESMREA